MSLADDLDEGRADIAAELLFRRGKHYRRSSTKTSTGSTTVTTVLEENLPCSYQSATSWADAQRLIALTQKTVGGYRVFVPYDRDVSVKDFIEVDGHIFEVQEVQDAAMALAKTLLCLEVK